MRQAALTAVATDLRVDRHTWRQAGLPSHSVELIVCRNCGFRNFGTDEFCGSCGGFLEFVGERVADSSPQPGSATPPPEIGPADQDELVTPAASRADSGDGSPPSEAELKDRLLAGVLVCPACAFGNTSDRQFCRECGASLLDAPVVRKRPWWSRVARASLRRQA